MDVHRPHVQKWAGGRRGKPSNHFPHLVGISISNNPEICQLRSLSEGDPHLINASNQVRNKVSAIPVAAPRERAALPPSPFQSGFIAHTPRKSTSNQHELTLQPSIQGGNFRRLVKVPQKFGSPNGTPLSPITHAPTP